MGAGVQVYVRKCARARKHARDSEVQNTLLASGWLASLAAVLEANPTHGGPRKRGESRSRWRTRRVIESVRDGQARVDQCAGAQRHRHAMITKGRASVHCDVSVSDDESRPRRAGERQRRARRAGGARAAATEPGRDASAEKTLSQGLHEAALGIIRGLSRHAQYRDDILNLGFIQAGSVPTPFRHRSSAAFVPAMFQQQSSGEQHGTGKRRLMKNMWASKVKLN